MLSPSQRQRLQEIGGKRVTFNVSMAEYSTLRAGGQVAALLDVQNREELTALLRYCGDEDIPWRVIGRGSNILVTDKGFAGVLCRLSGECRTIRKVGEDSKNQSELIMAGSGCLLAELLSWCRQHGFGGLEFLTGIPGGVGGAVRMNAGAFNHEIGELLQSVTIVDADGVIREIPVHALRLSYRNCAVDGCVMEKLVILAATLKLQRGDSAEIAEKMQQYMARRKEKQPVGHPSAGSFFKNPEGEYAGHLIEQTGMKGLTKGGAMVSPVHANFIVNVDSRATATDIIDLMHIVQEKVQKQTGIFLEPEVHIF